MINEIHGDLFSTQDSLIFHSVNCQKVMGAGVALAIRRIFPSVYTHYLNALPQLGKCDCIKASWKGRQYWVANLYGQDKYGHDNKLYANINAIEKSLISMFDFMDNNDIKSASGPKIGCGLGGMEYLQLKQLLEKITPSHITINIYYL